MIDKTIRIAIALITCFQAVHAAHAATVTEVLSGLQMQVGQRLSSLPHGDTSPTSKVLKQIRSDLGVIQDHFIGNAIELPKPYLAMLEQDALLLAGNGPGNTASKTQPAVAGDGDIVLLATG